MKNQPDVIKLKLDIEPEQPSEVDPGFKPKRDRGKPRFKIGGERVYRKSTFPVAKGEE